MSDRLNPGINGEEYKLDHSLVDCMGVNDFVSLFWLIPPKITLYYHFYSDASLSESQFVCILKTEYIIVF